MSKVFEDHSVTTHVYKHLYHIPDVTSADRLMETGRAAGHFILHQHKRGELCNNTCRAYWPGKAE
jgi:hypothetical protein